MLFFTSNQRVVFRAAVPNLFCHQVPGTCFIEDNFSMNRGRGKTGNGWNGFGMIQLKYTSSLAKIKPDHQIQFVTCLSLMRSLCSQCASLLMICICSLFPALPSLLQLRLRLRSCGIRFSLGVYNLVPAHVHNGFTLLWDSIAAADLQGGGAQTVLQAPVSKDRALFACPLLTSCCVTRLLTGKKNGTRPWPRVWVPLA